MKIANIILTSVNGGAEQVFVDYSRIFKKIGHHVVAITKEDAPYANEVSDLGIEVKKITNNFGYHDVFAIRKIKKILEEENIDAVFAHAGRAIELVKKAAKKIKHRKVFVVGINHSMNVKRSIGCDLIISVNKQIFFKTIDAKQPEDRSFVLDNAITLDDAPKSFTAIDLTKKHEIKLGVIGRFDLAKGFEHAIRAVNILNKSTDIKFILNIAGGGRGEKNLRNLVKKLGLENSVNFVGWVSNKKNFYQEIDVLIFPSNKETFGLVVIEAMKYQIPVVSSNADGPSEILRNEIDGLIFNVRQNDKEQIANEIAQKVLRLTTEENLANDLVKNSFERLCKKYSYDSLEKKLAEIVGKVELK
jgi:glycosyltransferase involved in cell wall biosynthesis